MFCQSVRLWHLFCSLIKRRILKRKQVYNEFSFGVYASRSLVFFLQLLHGRPLPPAREHDLGPKRPSNYASQLFMICFATSSPCQFRFDSVTPPAKRVRTRWVHTLTLALLTDSIFCCADAWGATPTSGMTARWCLLAKLLASNHRWLI